MLKIRENNIVNYNQKEIKNYKHGKVKVVKNEQDVIKFVRKSKNTPSNEKLYYGKVGKSISDEIMSRLGIDVEN